VIQSKWMMGGAMMKYLVTVSMKIHPILVAIGTVVCLFIGSCEIQAASLLDDVDSNDHAHRKIVVGPSLQVLAEQGNTRAQTILGFAYETGQGVPQNYYLAAKWYWRAAIRGNTAAQYLLGLMYDKGQGVPLDVISAQKWLILAAAHASGRQREYYMRIRDAVASKMDANEIFQAQYLAQQWTVKHERWPIWQK
jgi:TPR repeat protein